MTIKKGFGVGVLFLVVLLSFVPVISATLLDRGSYWNKFDNGGGSYNLEIYNSIVNHNDGGNLVSVNTSLDTTGCEASYDYCGDEDLYQAHFKTNVDWGEPVKILKGSYDIIYGPEEMSYGNDDSLNAGYIGELQTVTGQVNGNVFNYPDAFENTDLTYAYMFNQLKEIFVLKSLPSAPDPSVINGGNPTLDYSFTLDYNANLDIYVNGINEDGNNFETSEDVEFRNSSGSVIYYFPKPYAYDSNGENINILYNIRKQGQNVYVVIRTNYTWLNDSNRVFPVYIDPSLVVDGSSDGGDVYVDKSTANRNHGDKDQLKVQRSAWQRTYLNFNISAIPDGQVIDSASLCMFLDNDQGSQTISLNHVYDDSWCEGDGGTDGSPACEMTWNNQPCGDDETVIAGNCNATVEDTLVTDTSLDDTFQCFSIKNMLTLDYNDDKNLSLVLWTTDSGSADIFASKESADSSLWPYLNITYHTANEIPIVSSMSLTPTSPRTNDDLTCAFTITDGDAGDSLTANITWYKDNVVDWSTIISVTNGVQASRSFDSSNTAKNEVWNCTVIPYDEKNYGVPASENVTIQNSPPTTPTISLDPGSPYTGDDLVVDPDSQDDDGDSILYIYRWYQDGDYKAGQTSNTVSSTATSKNEVWLVNVTAYDGEEYSEKATDTVTIQNSLPTIDSASIVPTTAYETSTLTASASGWADLDGDTEGYTYQWFDQNGKISEATSPTLTGTDFSKGDQIHCNVTPWDSEDLGASELSNTVTILNSLPVLTVSLVSELGFNGMDEDLIGSFIYSDGDSDAISSNETKWFKDGVEQTDLADLSTISYTNTSADDVWIFSARANDGDEFGNWFNSSPLTILDISQTNPVLLIPANGTYFNVSSVTLRYVTPNYVNMNCTIYADTSTNPTTAIKNDTNIPTRTPITYTWENLQDYMYYWKASCTNNGALFNSTIKAFTVDTTYPITAPTLTSVSDSDKDGNIELSWTVDSDAATYNIYRSSAEILDATGLTAIASVSDIAWEDNTTLHDNSYWYALTTVDGAGNENKSVVSDSFNATANDTIKPKSAAGVNATSLNGVTTIYWSKVVGDINDNSDEFSLQYKIWYRQNSTVNLSKSLVNETADYIKIVGQDSCSGDSCSTTHSLSGSIVYYYFVTTIDDGGNENLTLDNNYANVTATTAPPGDPGGGGGSGGGGTTVKKVCKEDWSCSGWYSCVNDVQARTCVDINGCGTGINKPEETRACGDCVEEWQCGDWTACVNNRQTRVCFDKGDCETEKSKPGEEEECNLDTCSDGVKNYGEVGVDCGGPCRPCKASDFITGGAVALKSTKGPNRLLLIPTMILLVLFLVIKTARKSNVKFVKVASILRAPLIIAIAGLFIFSFFGPQITGLFTAGDEKIDLKEDYTTGVEPEPVPGIMSLDSDVEFDQRKGKIVSMIFFVIISLVLGGLFVRKRFPEFKFGSFRMGKDEEVILTQKQINEIDEDIKKSSKEYALVENVLKEVGVREEPFDNGVREPNKQEILNDIKNAYE